MPGVAAGACSEVHLMADRRGLAFTISRMRFAAVLRSFEALRRLRVRLGLSVVAVLTLAAGLVVLCVTMSVFGGVTEDVTQRNGLAISDLLHLRWFTGHRS